MTEYKGFDLSYVPSTALNHKGINVWLGLNHHGDKYIGVEFGKTFASYDVFRCFPQDIIDHLCKKAIDDNIENRCYYSRLGCKLCFVRLGDSYPIQRIRIEFMAMDMEEIRRHSDLETHINILIVDENEKFVDRLQKDLTNSGYNVTINRNGYESLNDISDNEFDLILIELNASEFNGLELLRRIRQHDATPVIIMAADCNQFNRTSSLDYGADDVISKTYQLEDLLARMRSIIRRTEMECIIQTFSNKIFYRDLTIDKKEHVVRRGNITIDLTGREYSLLLFLLEHMNEINTREVILDNVWGDDILRNTNVVDVYIKYLREKLDQPDCQTSYIQTVRGKGYTISY